MEQTGLFPTIVNVTDFRYRWTQVAKTLKKSKWPILVVEYSTPKAVIFLLEEAKKIWQAEKVKTTRKDPLIAWRRKFARRFSGGDAIKTIRKARDLRSKLS